VFPFKQVSRTPESTQDGVVNRNISPRSFITPPENASTLQQILSSPKGSLSAKQIAYGLKIMEHLSLMKRWSKKSINSIQNYKVADRTPGDDVIQGIGYLSPKQDAIIVEELLNRMIEENVANVTSYQMVSTSVKIS